MNTPWFNTMTGVSMVAEQFIHGIMVVALAGLLATTKRTLVTAGILPIDCPLFASLLIGVSIIVALFSYFPALALGPIVECFHLPGGKVF